MIWLVKTREKAISDGAKNLYVYLKDCMEPAEKDETINSLKEEIQKERTEKEKWYTILFRKFTIKISGNPVEVNKGLTDAYIEKSTQLAEWENRDGDELINIGNNYKKLHAHNWKDFLKLKSKAKTVANNIGR